MARTNWLGAAFALAASAAWAGDAGIDLDARVALELAAQKQKAVAKEAFRDLETAKFFARRDGKPLLVRYGEFDCLKTCGRVTEGVLCHLKPEADGKAKLRVMLYRESDAAWYYHEFDSPPTVEELRSRVRQLRQAP